MKSDTAVSRRMGYADVAESLRRMIQDGSIREGAFLPTERELTTKFDVSRTTVRRGLQNLVEMGWAEPSPNRGVIARSGPRLTKTTNIAFIDHIDTLNRYLFLALNQRLQTYGYHLVHVDSARLGVEGSLRYAAENDFACSLVWPKKGYLNLEEIDDANRICPSITIQHRFLNLKADLITEDHFQGGWLAAAQLAKTGRKRIAVTGMFDMLETNHKRFSGYMMGCFESGVQPHANDYVFCFTSNMEQPDTSLLEHRLKQDDRPDAIFVLDDYLVPNITEAIERCGLSVPNDVALVAFGNDVPYFFGEAGLTTISMDWDKVADATTDMLIKRLEGCTDPTQTISLPVQLIVRGSCGAPKDEWEHHPFYQHANNKAYAAANPHAYGPYSRAIDSVLKIDPNEGMKQ